jgi:hypothetical protein
MSVDAPAPRWLLVVRRDRPELYRDLARAFERVPELAVLLDRRTAAGRRESPTDQRRTPLTAAELELWETVGIRLIPPAVLVVPRPAPG